MPLEAFRTSESLSLGVELELQLVNVADFDLTGACADMLHVLDRRKFPGTATLEITDSMIEVATTVHTRFDTLRAQLRDMRDALVAAGDRLNVGVCGGGTHPFQHWPERRISPKPRFRTLSNLYGYLAKQFTVFGQHVHVGCRDGDEALYLLHALNRYVPHFIALSASSPFFQATDTLFNSSRLNSVFAFPLSGRAPFTLRWADFEAGYFARMESTGVVASMKDFYWDIRPKPEYGTIELRVCDTPLDVDRAAALAAYLQALCGDLLAGEPAAVSEDDYLVYTFNRFQACRFGLDGALVDPRTHESRSLREDVLATLRRVEPQARELGSLQALDTLYEVAHKGSDASFLREAFADCGTLEGVVDAALARFRSAAA